MKHQIYKLQFFSRFCIKIPYILVGNFGAHFYYGNTNSNSDCNLCNTQVDSQYGLQCDMCDRWHNPECLTLMCLVIVVFKLNVDIDFDPVLDPPSSAGLSFAHLNVLNGLDVESRIDEMRLPFKHKPFDIIGINETKLTTAHVTSNFNIDGYELLTIFYPITASTIVYYSCINHPVTILIISN